MENVKFAQPGKLSKATHYVVKHDEGYQLVYFDEDLYTHGKDIDEDTYNILVMTYGEIFDAIPAFV